MLNIYGPSNKLRRKSSYAYTELLRFSSLVWIASKIFIISDTLKEQDFPAPPENANQDSSEDDARTDSTSSAEEDGTTTDLEPPPKRIQLSKSRLQFFK